MKIFLVDDEETKSKAIASFVAERFPGHELRTFRSFQSGLHAIVTETPDLLLLDMTMPTYDVGPRESGGRERRYAGREVLRQMRRRRIELPVIVITQYEQFEEDGREVDLQTLRSELAEAYPGTFIDSVYFNLGDSNWAIALEALVRPLLNGRKAEK